MSDKFKGCTVTFDRDIHEEDIKHIVDAIKQLRCVVSVEPTLTTAEDHMNRDRISWEYKNKFIDFIKTL